MDTMNFMRTSLEKLVDNLDKPKFLHTGRYFQGDELGLMLRKGIYSYENIMDISKLRERSLPPEAFASRLGAGTTSNSNSIAPSHISDEDSSKPLAARTWVTTRGCTASQTSYYWPTSSRVSSTSVSVSTGWTHRTTSPLPLFPGTPC